MTTSRDMTARLFTLHPLQGFRPKTFAGHKDAVLNAYFAEDGKTVRTSLNVWTCALTSFPDIYC